MSAFTIFSAFFLLAACILDSTQARKCKTDRMGTEYDGNKAVTISGKTCQAWTENYPHVHSQSGSNMPEGNLEDAKNYCRNPDNSAYGPWCYTTDSGTRWEYCQIALCKYGETSATKDCYNGDGWSYIGKVKKADGYNCQKWTSQSPNAHSNGDDHKFPEFSAAAAKNYCRQPGNDAKPWCYLDTDEKRWAYCDIPEC